MKKTLTSTALALTSFATAFAQTAINDTGVRSLLALVQNVIDSLVPIVIGIAVLAFFWFLVKFISKGGEDGEARTKALTGMGWSLVALFVMISVWGIIGFLANLFGVGGTYTPTLPRVR